MVDDEFIELTSSISLFLKQYSPEQVIIAINIIELWPPNISSIIKQSILLNSFLSIPEKDFTCKKTLNTYGDFCKFNEYLIKLFPNFPMMEDYVPEIDWGDIKFEFENQYYNIFYGGCVERVPDFLQAFIIAHGNKPQTIAGTRYALKIQDNIINKLKNIIVLPTDVDNGHMEVPDEPFWRLCKEALANISQCCNEVPSTLTLKLGREKSYSSFEDFSTAFMHSQINQGLVVNISNKLFPFSIRNNISVVIDKIGSGPVDTQELSSKVTNYINQRITTFSKLPLQLFGSNEIYPIIVTSVFHYLDKFYLILILDDDRDTEEDFEKYLQRALRSTSWGFKEVNSPYAFYVKNERDNVVCREQIEILYLTGNVSIAINMYQIPKTGIFFPFSEFISIIDSVESIDELIQFINFTKLYKENKYLSMTAIVDKFAIFKDSSGILEKGAINFDHIFLDPHSGSNWRYKYLSNYWRDLIVDMPDNLSKWLPRNSYEGIQVLSANNKSTKYTWSTKISCTNIHFLIDIDELIELPKVNARLLNFFAESTADALSQRRNIISQLATINQYQNIIFICSLDKDYLINDVGEIPPTDTNFFEDLKWCYTPEKNTQDKKLKIGLLVNILAMKHAIENSKNSEFQGKLAKKILDIIYEIDGNVLSGKTIKLLEGSYNNKTRVALGTMKRPFDSLESLHILPEPGHYIIARKKLAEIIRDKGYTPGKYKLVEAKELINDISSDYLKLLQDFLLNFNKNKLIIRLLENYDAHINFKFQQSYCSLQSLKHEVAFNREESAYKLESDFVKDSNNQRYLLERLMANRNSGDISPSTNDIKLLLAYVDWLMTLYSASEVLHHGIHIGGIEIDSEYIPQVFFSKDFDELDRNFGLEQASTNLGIGVNEDDEVIGEITEDLLNELDLAFKSDVGFTFSMLLILLDILQSWADINRIELANNYTASINNIVSVCLKQISELSETKTSEHEIFKTLNFLTLDADRVLKKLESDVDEFDVPVLEYNKRDQRLNIKPLVNISDDILVWSAGCVYRTRHIWLSRIAEGCLPANFSWKGVNKVVSNIKVDIEKKLEKTTFEIFKRHFDPKYCHHGIDFMKRFKKEGFDDVGDYDVLVYLPNIYTWIMVECKYNQTPYCLQDARRLRDRIFGSGKKAHVPKILKRNEFLNKNHNKICDLLDYTSGINKTPKIVMLYVSRQIYWIHRHPPTPVNIEFIQVDKLDDWLGHTAF